MHVVLLDIPWLYTIPNIATCKNSLDFEGPLFVHQKKVSIIGSKWVDGLLMIMYK